MPQERLPAPNGLHAAAGRSLITLSWDPVPGAVGYLVHRSTRDGRYEPIDHGGRDVLAVPHPPYADATVVGTGPIRYAVATLVTPDGTLGELSAPVEASPLSQSSSATVEIVVDTRLGIGPLPRPWRRMIGADHLYNLSYSTGHHGRDVGREFAEALEIAHQELGVEAVRAHGILSDSSPLRSGRYDFGWQDSVYDQLLAIGLRPIVELSFMPVALARTPVPTVFRYEAPVSPPADLQGWGDLVRSFVGHLVGRYGREEVRSHWAFEVWNEPNLRDFWAGSMDEYFQLYESAARAVKSVDAHVRVGGPATAAAGWLEEFLSLVDSAEAPVDFLSTHTYGNYPLDLRPIAARHGRPELPLWWTEWGVSPTHFAEVNDSVFAAPFLLHGMKSAMGRLEALAYWVVTDHFEELGRPPRLFHGGFGLLTVGNLRKPRFWALAMLERLGPDRLHMALHGDGAGSLVDGLATSSADGSVSVLVWNGVLDQSKVDGDAALDRQVLIRLDRLSASRYLCRHWRVDAAHSNIAARWCRFRGGDWPDDLQWAELKAADKLEEYEPGRAVTSKHGSLALEFHLPMPGASLLEFTELG